MSLKTFHLIFIVSSAILMLGFGFWGLQGFTVNHDTGRLGLGVGAFFWFAALIGYLMWFIIKLRKVKNG